jgi:hypothetical protein
MTTTYWTGNGQNVAQTTTLTVTAVAASATLTATINGKAVTYTCTGSDTTSTAASAWQALLSGSTAPPEFGEVTWTVSGAVVTGAATSPGTPYTLTSSAGGGGAVTQTTTVANSSQSDVGNAANWLRSGSASLPQNGDDVVLADSSVPLLWNLTALAAVQFATFTRWQSFTGTVGLPENNPAGYYEYRPTYFQFTGPPAGTLAMTLGVGDAGAGPSRERYDCQSQRTNLVVLGSGGAADDYAVRFLSTNANNTARVTGTSVGVAMLPGEASTLASATVGAGGSLALGTGATFSGALNVLGGQATVNCAPGSLTVQQGGSATVAGTGLTYAAVTARNGSRLDWRATSTITSLTLETGAVLDKSADSRGLTVTNATVDGDSCQVLDPYSSITWTNPAAVRGGSFAGPFTFAAGRTVQIT